MPPRIDPIKRGRILQLRDENKTYTEIAACTGVSTGTAYKVVQRGENAPPEVPETCPGRPRIITDQLRRQIIRHIVNNCRQSYHEVARCYKGVTEQQVARIAREAGYRRRTARRKPFIDSAKMEKRMAWARENLGRDEDTVIYTDEASIQLGERVGHLKVTRRPGEEYHPDCLEPTFRSGRKSLMVWAAVAKGVVGPIIRLEMSPVTVSKSGKKHGGGLSAEGYAKQVIRGPLKDFVQEMEVSRGKKMVVVEDGAGPHKARLVQAARKEVGITRLTHPPSSPDLNLIEPLWLLLKTRLGNEPGAFASLDALWEAVQRIWYGFTADDLARNMKTLDERVHAILATKGGHTRF